MKLTALTPALIPKNPGLISSHRSGNLLINQMADTLNIRFGISQTEAEQQFRAAAKSGDKGAILGFLQAGKVKLNAQDHQGFNAAHYATAHGHLDILQAIIDGKADLNLQNKAGHTALTMAAARNNPAAIKILIAKGIDLNKQDIYGNSAAIWAAQQGYHDVLKLLIDAQADLELKDHTGATALICAAKKNDIEALKMLIAAGADVNKQNNEGETAAIYATRWAVSKNGNTDTLNALIEAKANLKLIDKFNRNAVDYAVQAGKVELTQLILSHCIPEGLNPTETDSFKKAYALEITG